MENKDSKVSFWSTMPGMLTALGAIIGASAGLITALYSAGIIGTKDKPPANAAANVTTIHGASPESKPNDSPKPEQTTFTEASRNFIIGRWVVEQVSGEVSGGTVIDYEDDGTFSGSKTIFVGGDGQKQRTAGNWNLEKLSKDKFRLKLRYENQTTWVGTFKIIDPDHIHNIDHNYIASRSK
jgi:hypothetical protein